MGNTFISDSADVTMRRKSDGHTVFTGSAQLAGLSATLESEIIRGGIGNAPQYTIKHSKDITLTVRDSTFDIEYLAMSQGVSIEEGTAQVTKTETGLEVTSDEVDGLQVTITGTPVDNTVTLIDENGEQVEAANTSQVVTVPEGFAEVGERITVLYKEEVTGNILKIEADKFSESYEIEYATIEYDKKTNRVVRDIYFQFFNVSPSGEFEMQMENGTALTPEITLSAMAENGSIGQVIQVPRTDTP